MNASNAASIVKLRLGEHWELILLIFAVGFVFAATMVYVGERNKDKLLFSEGKKRMLEGDYAGAMHYFSRAVVSNDESSLAHNALGVLFMQLGDTEKAALHLQKAANGEARVKALINMCAVRHRMGMQSYPDYLSCLTSIKDGYDYGKEDKGALYYNISCARSMVGDVEGALDALTEAKNSGYGNLREVLGDLDLVALRSTTKYKEILGEISKRIVAKYDYKIRAVVDGDSPL